MIGHVQRSVGRFRIDTDMMFLRSFFKSQVVKAITYYGLPVRRRDSQPEKRNNPCKTGVVR